MLSPDTGQFDTVDKDEILLQSRLPGLAGSVQGVMVGKCKVRDPLLNRAGNQVHRTEGPIRSGTVTMEINAIAAGLGYSHELS